MFLVGKSIQIGDKSMMIAGQCHANWGAGWLSYAFDSPETACFLSIFDFLFVKKKELF